MPPPPLGPPADRRIGVCVPNGIEVISASEIDWLEAARHYVRVHCGPKQYLVRGPFSTFVEKLGSQFVTVNRSAAVSISRIRSVLTPNQRTHVVQLESGVTIRISRGLWRRFLQQTDLKVVTGPIRARKETLHAAIPCRDRVTRQ